MKKLKRNREQFKRLFRLFLTGVLVLIQTIIFASIWLKNYNENIVLPFVERGNWFIYALYALLLITFLHSFDGIKYGRYRKSNIIISQCLAILFTVFFSYLVIVLLSAGFVTVIPLLILTAISIAISFVFTIIADFIFGKVFTAKKTVIIYDAYSPEVFIEKLKLRKDKFSLKQIVNVSEGIDKLEEAIKSAQGVILYDIHAEMRNKLLKICFENDIRAYATTKISDVLVRGAECIHLFDTPLLLYRNNGMTIEQKFVKRAMDIVVSLLMLIIASPFMIISAIAIKLCDGGPIFFRQKRATINGKVFEIHKFRTMIVNAEKDGTPLPAIDNDPRVTPVGKILRASRLDELPQLFDILVGNMSLVGPRPERIEHVEAYTKEVPEFQYRLKVKGGLTGYAQLYGKYNTPPYDKLQLDLMYIQNYSLLLDLKLILMTVKIMFMKESTDGFESKEK
ncbi:MAG: exopolysaccharide biosynthesis polyprenyl glycosylphosphotransferase [Clostridia bacterium]|nr:exopolysaccharide biosynthesis polyprenyl glycosylphosphotransferase [Clostridia bacterium]